jgi:hypothetical protein
MNPEQLQHLKDIHERMALTSLDVLAKSGTDDLLIKLSVPVGETVTLNEVDTALAFFAVEACRNLIAAGTAGFVRNETIRNN